MNNIRHFKGFQSRISVLRFQDIPNIGSFNFHSPQRIRILVALLLPQQETIKMTLNIKKNEKIYSPIN